MPRSMWSGVIGFGMVSIPVSMQTATSSKSISFHQIHAECQTRIKELRFCPTCDREVAWDEIQKGYEYSKGEYLEISEDDLEKLPLPSKNMIEIIQFVKLEEVDPIYFEKTYSLEPNKAGKHAFGLLTHVLEDKELIGLGMVTLRTKERLCALRPVGSTILMSTLFYPDEINIDIDAKAPAVKIPEKEAHMAASLVDMLTSPFDPTKFEDRYRSALNKLIDSKLEGKKIAEPKDQKKGNVLDLMESLQASLDNIKAGSKSTKAEAKKESSSNSEPAASASKKTRAKSGTRKPRTRKKGVA